MKFYLDCYPCLLNQVLKTAEIEQLTEEQTYIVIQKTLEYLLNIKGETLPLHIITWIYEFVTEQFYKGKMFDPYATIKCDTNNAALKYTHKLEHLITTSDNPLEMMFKIAAAGNIIDFGAKHSGKIDIENEIDTINELSFSLYHGNGLINHLKKAKTVLYIGDNSGEIVFDKVCIEFLKKEFSHLSITYVVRDKPIINDITLEDAQYVQIDKVVPVISSGSKYPGTILPETTKSFQEQFSNTDVIIAKGQGNYESLCDLEMSKIYHILRIKCDIVARHINGKLGDLVLWNKL